VVLVLGLLQVASVEPSSQTSEQVQKSNHTSQSNVIASERLARSVGRDSQRPEVAPDESKLGEKSGAQKWAGEKLHRFAYEMSLLGERRAKREPLGRKKETLAGGNSTTLAASSKVDLNSKVDTNSSAPIGDSLKGARGELEQLKFTQFDDDQPEGPTASRGATSASSANSTASYQLSERQTFNLVPRSSREAAGESLAAASAQADSKNRRQEAKVESLAMRDSSQDFSTTSPEVEVEGPERVGDLWGELGRNSLELVRSRGRNRKQQARSEAPNSRQLQEEEASSGGLASNVNVRSGLLVVADAAEPAEQQLMGAELSSGGMMGRRPSSGQQESVQPLPAGLEVKTLSQRVRLAERWALKTEEPEQLELRVVEPVGNSLEEARVDSRVGEEEQQLLARFGEQQRAEETPRQPERRRTNSKRPTSIVLDQWTKRGPSLWAEQLGSSLAALPAAVSSLGWTPAASQQERLWGARPELESSAREELDPFGGAASAASVSFLASPADSPRQQQEQSAPKRNHINRPGQLGQKWQGSRESVKVVPPSGQPPAKSAPSSSKARPPLAIQLAAGSGGASGGIRVTVGNGTRPLVVNRRGLITAAKKPVAATWAQQQQQQSLAGSGAKQEAPARVKIIVSNKQAAKQPQSAAGRQPPDRLLLVPGGPSSASKNGSRPLEAAGHRQSAAPQSKPSYNPATLFASSQHSATLNPLETSGQIQVLATAHSHFRPPAIEAMDLRPPAMDLRPPPADHTREPVSTSFTREPQFPAQSAQEARPHFRPWNGTQEVAQEAASSSSLQPPNEEQLMHNQHLAATSRPPPTSLSFSSTSGDSSTSTTVPANSPPPKNATNFMHRPPYEKEHAGSSGAPPESPPSSPAPHTPTPGPPRRQTVSGNSRPTHTTSPHTLEPLETAASQSEPANPPGRFNASASGSASGWASPTKQAGSLKLKSKLQTLLVNKLLLTKPNGGQTAAPSAAATAESTSGEPATSASSPPAALSTAAPPPLLSGTVANNVAVLLAQKLGALVRPGSATSTSGGHAHHAPPGRPSLMGLRGPGSGPLAQAAHKWRQRVNPFASAAATPMGAHTSSIHRRTTGVGPLLVSGLVYGLTVLPALMALTGVNPLAGGGVEPAASSTASQRQVAPGQPGRKQLQERRKSQAPPAPSRPHDWLAAALDPELSPASLASTSGQLSSSLAYLIPLIASASSPSSSSSTVQERPSASGARHHHAETGGSRGQSRGLASEAQSSALKSLYAPPPTVLEPSRGTLSSGFADETEMPAPERPQQQQQPAWSNLVSADELRQLGMGGHAPQQQQHHHHEAHWLEALEQRPGGPRAHRDLGARGAPPSGDSLHRALLSAHGPPHAAFSAQDADARPDAQQGGVGPLDDHVQLASLGQQTKAVAVQQAPPPLSNLHDQGRPDTFGPEEQISAYLLPTNRSHHETRPHVQVHHHQEQPTRTGAPNWSVGTAPSEQQMGVNSNSNSNGHNNNINNSNNYYNNLIDIYEPNMSQRQSQGRPTQAQQASQEEMGTGGHPSRSHPQPMVEQGQVEQERFKHSLLQSIGQSAENFAAGQLAPHSMLDGQSDAFALLGPFRAAELAGGNSLESGERRSVARLAGGSSATPPPPMQHDHNHKHNWRHNHQLDQPNSYLLDRPSQQEGANFLAAPQQEQQDRSGLQMLTTPFPSLLDTPTTQWRAIEAPQLRKQQSQWPRNNNRPGNGLPSWQNGSDFATVKANKRDNHPNQLGRVVVAALENTIKMKQPKRRKPGKKNFHSANSNGGGGGATINNLNHSRPNNRTTTRAPILIGADYNDHDGQLELQMAHSMAMGSRVLNERLSEDENFFHH